MKSFNLTKAALVLGLALSLTTSAHAAENTQVDVEIVPGIVTIAAPGLLDFGTGQVATTTQVVALDMATYSGGSLYFSVRDLKGAPAGYHTTLEVGNFTVSGTAKQIDSDNMFITTDNATNTGSSGAIGSIELGITKLDGLVNPTPQPIPDEVTQSALTYEVIGSASGSSAVGVAPTLMKRTSATTPDSGILGDYGVQPLFNIEIPKFQELGTYTADMLYTLIEN